MNATLRTTQPVTLPRLLTAPIEQLLADSGAIVHESRITDREFYGAAVVHTGRPILLMPAARTELERDIITRYLLGQALGLDVAALPSPFDVVIRPLAGIES